MGITSVGVINGLGIFPVLKVLTHVEILCPGWGRCLLLGWRGCLLLGWGRCLLLGWRGCLLLGWGRCLRPCGRGHTGKQEEH
jgi:hypothetical protein